MDGRHHRHAPTPIPNAPTPVVVVRDDDPVEGAGVGVGGHYDYDECSSSKKRAKTAASPIGLSRVEVEGACHGHGPSPERRRRPRTLRPGSSSLLADMLHPMALNVFLENHFRRDAVHVRRDQSRGKDIVADISHEHLFDLDARQIFAETSSESVFLWLLPRSDDASPKSTGQHCGQARRHRSLDAQFDSVEISSGDPETAYSLHACGSHPAYCRAPPELERRLVGPLLRATGMGGGHYQPPHHDADIATLGGGTTLGRGEVELFISSENSHGDKSNGRSKGHTTGWHTDFQENFTIQLSGVKRWTLRRGRVRHPLCGTTPHYKQSAVENQLKVARLSCMDGYVPGSHFSGGYGFEYGEDNALGPEATVTLHPGDILYFPPGMWHRVETIEPGVSANVSLMGTTYAQLACEALRHVMVGSDERWREVVTSRPGEGAVDGAETMRQLLAGLGALLGEFVHNQGGARSVLPPALCYPPLGGNGNNSDGEGEMIDEGLDLGGSEEDHGSGGEEGELIDVSKGDRDDDLLSSGIVVSIDDFEGPQGWSCQRPPGARPVRNPLASLMPISDVFGRIGMREGLDVGVKVRTTANRYILNINFAGNEIMESHVRVILETRDPATAHAMECFLEAEKKGSDLGEVALCSPNNGGDWEGAYPLPCLFYYGYLVWVGGAE